MQCGYLSVYGSLRLRWMFRHNIATSLSCKVNYIAFFDQWQVLVEHKKRTLKSVLDSGDRLDLFNLSLFVSYVLANNRIKFHDLHLLRLGTLVFGGGVKVACASCGFKFNLFAHHVLRWGLKWCALQANLYGFAASTNAGEYGINAALINQAQTSACESQAYPAIFTLYPKATRLQVRQKAAFCSIVGVRYVVANHRFFTSYLAYFSHSSLQRASETTAGK
jgi:hypothetical protein